MRRGVFCFFFVSFAVLMVVACARGHYVFAWMVDFPLLCFYLWFLIVEERQAARLARLREIYAEAARLARIREIYAEVLPRLQDVYHAPQDEHFGEDRDSLVEFYREGL